MPDGRCSFAVRQQKTRDFEDELRELEREERKFKFRDDFY